MCVANSARSQLAEGLAKHIFGASAEIASAGSKPGRVNPLAVESMKEIGIDLAGHRSKSTDDLPAAFVDGLDFVITLCAEEVCPLVISPAKKLHWPLPDPAGHDELTHAEKLALFQQTRDVLQEKLVRFKAELKL